MAIIKGFKALEVGEADWLQTDISEVKDALKNQQDRYDAASLEMAEMAEKMNFDVRDNEEDLAEREKIAAEYYRRIREAEDNFGGDLSRLNKGFYKEQASEVLRDPMVRHLMETKKEADEIAKLKREVEKEHGEAIIFGNDARYDSLLDAQGRFRNFKDVSVQKHLDHIPVINEMAENLGETISEQLRIINEDDDDFKALDPARRKLLSDEILLEINTHYSDNTYQVRTIIDNLADSFRNTPAGSQLYHRMLREEMALTNDPKVAAKIAFERLNFAMRNQIEARIKQKYAEKANLHRLPYYQNKGGSGGGGNNNNNRNPGEKPKKETLPTPVITQNEFSQTSYNSENSMIQDLNNLKGVESDNGMVLETGKSVISQQTSIYSTSGVLNAPVHASKDLRDNNTKNKIPNKAISTPGGFVEAAHGNLVGNRAGNTNGYNPALAQINRLNGSGKTQLERIVSYSVFDNDINGEDEYGNPKSDGTELGSYIGNYEDLDTLATLKAIQNLKNKHPTLVGISYDQVRSLDLALKSIVDIEKNKVLQELVGGDGDLFTTLKASVGKDFSLKIALSEELYMMKDALEINRKHALSQTKNESQIAAINASYDRSRKNLDYKIAFGEGVKKLAFLEGDELMEEIKKFSNESGIDADHMESYILNLKPIINNHHSMVQKYETLKGTIDVILSGQDLEESEKNAILDPNNPNNLNQPPTKEMNRIRNKVIGDKLGASARYSMELSFNYSNDKNRNVMISSMINNAVSLATEEILNGGIKSVSAEGSYSDYHMLNFNIDKFIINKVLMSIRDYATTEEYKEVEKQFGLINIRNSSGKTHIQFTKIRELYDNVDGKYVYNAKKAEIIRGEVDSEFNEELKKSNILRGVTKAYAKLNNVAKSAVRRHVNTYSLVKGSTENDDMYETYKGAVMASATASIQSMAFPTDDPSYNVDNMPRLAIHDNKGKKIENINNLSYEMLTFDHPIAKQIINAMSESEKKEYNTIDKALTYLISKDTNLRGITVDFDTQIYRNENGTFSGKPFTVNFNVPIMTDDGTASSILVQIPLADMSLELLMAAGVPSHLIYYAGQVSADYTENKKAGFTLEAPMAKKLGDTSTKRQFIRIPVDTKIGNVPIAAGSVIMIDAPLGREYDSIFDYIEKNQMNKDKPGGFYVFKDESQAIYKYHSMYGGNPKDDILKKQADLKKKMEAIESQYPKGIGGAVNPTAYQMIKNQLGTDIADDYMYFGGVEGWSAAMSVRVKSKLEEDGVIGPRYVIAKEKAEGSDVTFTIKSSSDQNKNNDGTDYQSSAKGGTEQLLFEKASGNSYTPKREDVLQLGSRGILQLYTMSRKKRGFNKTNDPIIAIYEKVVESGKSLENNDELKIMGYNMTNIARPGEKPVYDIYRSGVPIDYNRDSEYFMTNMQNNKQVLKLNKGVVPAATPELRNIANLFFDDFITRDKKNGYDKDRHGDIIVTSMGRGVGHNIAVYANDFGRLTQSDHMDGNAMDISLNESTASGKKLKSWIIENQNNEELLEFLEMNNIYLLLHAIEGQAYHLHFQYKIGGKLEIKANQNALKEKMENDKNNNKKTKK